MNKHIRKRMARHLKQKKQEVRKAGGDLDALDRIKQWLVLGGDLDDADQAIFERLSYVHELSCQLTPKNEMAKLVAEKYGITKRQVYRDIPNSYTLFGEIGAVDKEGLRYVYHEAYLDLFNKLKDEGDWNAARQVLDSLVKLQQLDQQEEQTIRRKTQVIRYSTDPKVLNQQPEGIEAEEITEEEYRKKG